MVSETIVWGGIKKIRQGGIWEYIFSFFFEASFFFLLFTGENGR